MPNITLEECLRAPWLKSQGLDPSIASKNYGKDNGFADFFNNKAGTRLIPFAACDTGDNFHLNGAVYRGPRQLKTFNLATNASITTQAFWIADDNYVVMGISCIFATADGAANTAFVGKAIGTGAPSTAKSMMVGTFNMNATAATVQSATLPAWLEPSPPATLSPGLTLAKGDRLVFVLASAVTSLAGVSITVELAPGSKSSTVDYVMNVNSGIATTALNVSNGSYIITGVQAVWSTAGTNGGAVTGDITIESGTTAPGGGTSALAAAFSLKTTANTVVSPALSATAANLRVNAGGRISFKTSGTLTALAGLVIVVSLQPLMELMDLSFTLASNANLGVDQTIFEAINWPYELVAASCIFATAAGGALTLNVTRESGTTAAGGGTSMQSGTFNLNATANTTQVATQLTLPNNFLLKGDRLSIHFSAGAQALAGLVVTITLRPR